MYFDKLPVMTVSADKKCEILAVALQKGGVDVDQVNTRLGIALARSGQKDEARKYLSAVTGPRADIAKYWMLYLDLQP